LTVGRAPWSALRMPAADILADTAAAVRPVSAEARAAARDRLDRMTKPRGALGRVEDLAVALAGIARACPPPLPEPAAVAVFAGDHGVHAQGVTPWPQEVTAQMVANFLAGGAVVNAFARQVGASVTVVDVGVRTPLDAHPDLRRRRVADGTADMTVGPAMTRDQARQAVEVGIAVARELVAEGHHFQRDEAGELERGRAAGDHVGAQVYASLRGEVLADMALGLARTNPDVPMRPDTLMLWLSATKPVAAVAVAQLWERGLLDLDDPVARHIETFAARGKEAITIRHLLTHTGGFRALAGSWEDQPWDRIISAIFTVRLEADWVPGQKAGYHLATSWYVLGELVRRLDPEHRPFEQYVRDMIFQPLGMNDSWVGLPPERYRAYGQRIGFMHETTNVAAPRSPHPNDTEAGAAACRPGSNGRGPARELGYFYEMLLGRGQRNGTRVLTPQSVEAITAPHRVGMYDLTFRHTMDLTLDAWGRLSREGLLGARQPVAPRPGAAQTASVSERVWKDDDRPKIAGSCHVRCGGAGVPSG